MSVKGKFVKVSPTLFKSADEAEGGTKYAMEDCRFLFKLSNLALIQTHSVHKSRWAEMTDEVFDDEFDFYRKYLAEKVELEIDTTTALRGIGEYHDFNEEEIFLLSEIEHEYEVVPTKEISIRLSPGESFLGKDGSVWPKGIYGGRVHPEYGGWEHKKLTGKLNIRLEIPNQQFQELEKAFRDELLSEVWVGVNLLAYMEESALDFGNNVLIDVSSNNIAITDYISVVYNQQNLKVNDDVADSESLIEELDDAVPVKSNKKALLTGIAGRLSNLTVALWILVAIVGIKLFW